MTENCQQQSCSKEQAWYHIFATAPAVFKIPKEQQDILNRSNSWYPAPPANLPQQILDELLQQSERHEPYLTKESPSLDISTSISSFTVTSSPSSDSESHLSGWHSSPVAEKMSTALRPGRSALPPDSSPPIQIPKPNVEMSLDSDSEMETNVPHALWHVSQDLP